MATSGTTSATLTARQVVTAALEEIGILPLGETVASEDAAKAMQVLGLMLKTWQVDGVGLQWCVQEIALTWPASTTAVTLNTNYLDLRNVRRRASNIDTPLYPLSISEYAELSNKAATGTPTSYSVLKTRTTLEVRIWPVPTADTAIYAEGLRIIEDVTDLGQDLDVPQEWLETVYVCLAARLLAPYRVHVSDPALAADVRQRAAALYQRLASFDEERESVFLGPELR